MAGSPYYKRFPQDALNGKRHLSMEQRAVYDTVIDLIMADDGPPHVLAIASEFSGGQRRKVLRVINELLELGKLDRIGDRVTNCRAEFELTAMFDAVDRNKTTRKRTYAAWRDQWAKRRVNGELTHEKFNEIKGPSRQSGPTRAREDSEIDPVFDANCEQMSSKRAFGRNSEADYPMISRGVEGHVEVDKIREERTLRVPKNDEPDEDELFAIPKRKAKRTLPDDWAPTVDDLGPETLAKVMSWEPGEFETQCEMFKAHAHMTDRRVVRWDQALTMWLTKHHDQRARRGNGYAKPAGAKVPDLGHDPQGPPPGTEWDEYLGTFVPIEPTQNLIGGPTDEPRD
jgi:hypothetical protein